MRFFLRTSPDPRGPLRLRRQHIDEIKLGKTTEHRDLEHLAAEQTLVAEPFQESPFQAKQYGRTKGSSRAVTILSKS